MKQLRLFRPRIRSDIAAPVDCSSSTAGRLPRLNALDGLRGVAAIVVLLNHALQVSPALSLTESVDPSSVPGRWLRLLAYSPLRLFWAGTEAVVVFFVLSGFVLARPVVRLSAHPWAEYYGRRMVRLYVPVVAAVALAISLRLIVRPRPIFRDNEVMNHLTVHRGIGAALNDLVLLFKPGYWNPVLWSLRWEVLFSLLLPAFVVLGRLGSKRPLLACVALGMTMAVSPVTDKAFLYFPMFGCGVLLATTEKRWRPLCIRAAEAHRGGVILLGLCCVALMNCTALLQGWAGKAAVRFSGSSAGFTLLQAAVTVGAVLTIGAVQSAPGPRRFLSSAPMQWLGSRSYSLYLVHLPIVLAVAYAFGGWSWPGLAVALFASVSAAELFFRAVERPGIAWARAAGRWTDGAADGA